MATNIQMNILQDSGNYETIYPETDYNILKNKPTLVTSYNQLTDKPTLVTSYNQLTDKPVIPTVPSFPLSVNNGGTGVTSYSSLANKLNSYISTGLVVQSISYVGNGGSGTSNRRKTFPAVSGKTLTFCLYNLDYSSSGSIKDISDNVKTVVVTGAMVNFDISIEKQWFLHNYTYTSSPIVSSYSQVKKITDTIVEVNNDFNKTNITYYLTGIWI